MRRNTLIAASRKHLHQHQQITNNVSTRNGSPVVRREDEQAYQGPLQRIHPVHLYPKDVIYNIILMGQKKYNSTTGRNLVQVATHQHQPLLCPIPIYERGSHYSRGTMSRAQGTGTQEA